jgi:hypothetical protein
MRGFKALLVAVLVALMLVVAVNPARAQSSYYFGTYPMSGWWGWMGYYCSWSYQIFYDGHGYYYDSCGGGVAWF